MWLEQAGAIKVFTDVRSGRTLDQPELIALLHYARRGDTLAVVRLDRLGRSLTELLATIASLKERGIVLVSLEERLNTSSAAAVPTSCDTHLAAAGSTPTSATSRYAG